MLSCTWVNLLKNNLFKRKEIGTENDGERGQAVKKVEVVHTHNHKISKSFKIKYVFGAPFRNNIMYLNP